MFGEKGWKSRKLGELGACGAAETEVTRVTAKGVCVCLQQLCQGAMSRERSSEVNSDTLISVINHC